MKQICRGKQGVRNKIQAKIAKTEGHLRGLKEAQLKGPIETS